MPQIAGSSASSELARQAGDGPPLASANTSRSPLHPPLSRDELIALKQACGPVDLRSFPPVEVIHALRQRGYITIVLGGLQITDRGLERLVQERNRAQPHR